MMSWTISTAIHVALTGLPPLQRRGRYGGYINFQQQLTSNLSVFLNVVMAEKGRRRSIVR